MASSRVHGLAESGLDVNGKRKLLQQQQQQTQQQPQDEGMLTTGGGRSAVKVGLFSPTGVVPMSAPTTPRTPATPAAAALTAAAASALASASALNSEGAAGAAGGAGMDDLAALAVAASTMRERFAAAAITPGGMAGNLSHTVKEARPASAAATPSSSSNNERDEQLIALCHRLNIDKLTIQHALRLWACVQPRLCADDPLFTKQRWLAFVVYTVTHPELRAAETNTAASSSLRNDDLQSCVSIISIVRSTNLSPLEFFRELSAFAARLSAVDTQTSADLDLFRMLLEHASKQQQVWEVSTILGKRFNSVFDWLFPPRAEADSDSEDADRSAAAASLGRSPGRQSKAKARVRVNVEATRKAMRHFAWNLFVLARGQAGPALSGDLNESYALLLCCLAWCYQNARELPAFKNADMENGRALYVLCKKHTMSTAQHSFAQRVHALNDLAWLPYLKKLQVEGSLDLTHSLLGAFFPGEHDSRAKALEPKDPSAMFERNRKLVQTLYDNVLLQSGLLDDRPIIDEVLSPATSPRGEQGAAAAAAAAAAARDYRELAILQHLVSFDVPATEPPESLVKMAEDLHVSPAWRKTLVAVCQRLQDTLRATANSVMDESLALETSELASRFFYKLLQSVVTREDAAGRSVASIFSSGPFTESLYACSTEIVLFAAQCGSGLQFPWSLRCLDVPPFEFQKIVEPVIRAENGLSRAVVHHLGLCESSIVMELAWERASPLLSLLARSPPRRTNSNAGAGSALLPETPNASSVVKSPANALAPHTSVDVFLRKLYSIARRRLHLMAEKLQMSDQFWRRVSACLRVALEHNNFELLQGRHLDQLILCSIVATSRAGQEENVATFSDVIACYHRIPQTEARICFHVPISGSQSGNIVEFYNRIFVPATETHLRNRSTTTATTTAAAAANATATPCAPEHNLSDLLPDHRVRCLLGGRTISCTTPLTVSTFTSPASGRLSMSPQMHYSFQTTPSRKLADINSTIRSGSRIGARGATPSASAAAGAAGPTSSSTAAAAARNRQHDDDNDEEESEDDMLDDEDDDDDRLSAASADEHVARKRPSEDGQDGGKRARGPAAQKSLQLTQSPAVNSNNAAAAAAAIFGVPLPRMPSSTTATPSTAPTGTADVPSSTIITQDNTLPTEESLGVSPLDD
eukprot:m.206338 g.206338  ORF g.206338 m.206338 type:complete len:1157 (+) comp17772_c1_seq12:1322-4792(+)